MAKNEFELIGEGYLRLGRYYQAKSAFEEAGKEMREFKSTRPRVPVAVKVYQGATPKERLLIKGDQCLVDGDLVMAGLYYEEAEAMES